jgi:hypothetical protein
MTKLLFCICFYFRSSGFLQREIRSVGMSAAGATAKGVAGFFLMMVIVVAALCGYNTPVIITFFYVCAGQARQQQDIKGEYE